MSELIAAGWSVRPDRDPYLAKTYLPHGKAVRFGDVFANPDLARFYEAIGRDGPGAFYEGQFAERIVKFSQAVGGRFSLRDFREHRANWIDPVTSSYRGYDVWELPPNGQGIATLQILNLLETFDIGALGPNSAEHLHLFLEAKKLAYEDRARVLRRHGFRQGAAGGVDLEGTTLAGGPGSSIPIGPPSRCPPAGLAAMATRSI